MDKWQKDFIRKWQGALRLRDWDLTWKTRRRFLDGGTTGEVSNLSIPFQHATVTIKKGLSKKEWQQTTLHELLHVRFPGLYFPDGSAMDLVLEQGIELTARALLGERLE